MYIAIESFTTKNYDVKRKQVLEDDFTTQDEIQDLLNANYIKVYDDTLEITENGNYDVKEYDFADVEVSGGEVNLQSKNITITQNGTQTVTADTGYDGLSSINITTNVSGNENNAKINNPTDTYINVLSLISEISSLDTSNATNLQSLFNGCSNLIKISLIDTSNCTNAREMFRGCTSLTVIPSLNTSKVTNMMSMFLQCSNITTIPLIDTSKATNTQSMFQQCTNLTTLPLLDLSSSTTTYCMFQFCSNLTTVPVLDLSSATNLGNMFQYCSSLSDDSINNILAMCINATSYTGTKTLTALGLNSTQRNKASTLSNWNAFVEAGWSA